MILKRSIELLSPAKNLECGIAAIDHGADAVYIGAPKFGARASAGNSIEDIAQLVEYAHQFNARIYVTVNTILKDEELAETEQLIWELYRIHVDALIVQDMGITRLNIPPIPLHASTQMDNRTPEKVRFLAEAGFKQVVLARELSLEQIRSIHEACPDVPLEVFVHGALCVSFSGQCYASQACFNRSANRGECAQFCRLPFNLIDADGKEIMHEKHLLSLKDMSQSDLLEQMLDAGVTSFKIEGRLKDVDYVKNVTAYYRQKLDAILQRRTEYRKASSGTSTYTFKPDLSKSFNRGFTHYFLEGRQPDIAQFNTPKAMGEEMGRVKEVRGNCITVARLKVFHNGDGLCYIDGEGHLQGFRVNRVEQNKLYLMTKLLMPKPGTKLYRNLDAEFAETLSKRSAERKIAIAWEFYEIPVGFALSARDEDGNEATLSFPCEKQLAEKPQRENIIRQLSKLGNTIFAADESFGSYSLPPSGYSPFLKGRAWPATPLSQPSLKVRDWPIDSVSQPILKGRAFLSSPSESEGVDAKQTGACVGSESAYSLPPSGYSPFLRGRAWPATPLSQPNLKGRDWPADSGSQPILKGRAFLSSPSESEGVPVRAGACVGSESTYSLPQRGRLMSNQEFFIPSSLLSDWRRQVIEKLMKVRRIRYQQEVAVWKETNHPYPQESLSYLGNVMNEQARAFYAKHGVKHIDDAFEKQRVDEAVVMFCKHCLRYSMGWCPNKQHGKSPYREPYYLKSLDGKTFRLQFDCKACQMKVIEHHE